MATKPKRCCYRIQYTDNTYQLVDWTKTEWDSVKEGMEMDNRVTVLDDCIFVLSDIRAIVNIPIEEPEPVEETKQPSEGQMTEWGFVTTEEAESLRELGIDLGKVSK